MPLDRIIAVFVILVVAFLDYIGLVNPLAQKPAEEKKVIEYNLKTEAMVNIIGDIGKYGMNETVKIKCEIKNTGKTKFTFPISVNIAGPDLKITLPIKKSYLDPEKSEILTFEYKVPENAKEGFYTADVIAWESVQGDNSQGKLSSSQKPFELIDMPPQIQFLNLGLSAAVGEKLNIKVRVKDDRGARSVKISYQLPGMSSSLQVAMRRTLGTEKDGVWEFVTDPPNQTGKFLFLVEAMDSKSQIVKTEEYKIAIVGKK